MHIPVRLKNNARVIAKRELDLVVIQEVKADIPGEWVLKDIIHQLNITHNRKYKWMISPAIGLGFGITEAIGFLYDSTTVNATSKIDLIDSGGSRDFARCSFVSNDFDFTVIAGHLAWSNADKRRIEYQKIDDKLQNPGNYSEDPDVIVLGDFNRFGKNQVAVKEIQFDHSKMFAPTIEFWDKGFNTIKEVNSSLIQGRGIPNDDPQLLSTTVSDNFMVYDMIICIFDVMEEFGVPMSEMVYNQEFGVIAFDHSTSPDVIPEANSGSIRDNWSDHRPIWIKLKTNIENRDFD